MPPVQLSNGTICECSTWCMRVIHHPLTPMKHHPTTLPDAQRQHLAQAVRRHGVAAVCRALDLGRESVTKLASGLPALPGTVALAQTCLPRLDAALADASPLPGAA